MSLKDGITANLELKLLALFMAAVLWHAATRHHEVEESLTVPVTLENVPALLTVAGTLPVELRIVVAGPETDLMLQSRGGLKSVLDMKGLGPGTVSFDSLATVHLRSGLRIVRVQPSRIELRLVDKE